MDDFCIKTPDATIVKIPRFRAATSGITTFEELFGGNFPSWMESHKHLFSPIIFGSQDFLCGENGKIEWIISLNDDVSQDDISPYEIIDFPGGLYAVAVSIDGDGESHDKTRERMEQWLKHTKFTIDNDRELMGHMIYADEDEIKKGLGYNQMNLYIPVKIKNNT